jgi:hypothetical protein
VHLSAVTLSSFYMYKSAQACISNAHRIFIPSFRLTAHINHISFCSISCPMLFHYINAFRHHMRCVAVITIAWLPAYSRCFLPTRFTVCQITNKYTPHITAITSNPIRQPILIRHRLYQSTNRLPSLSRLHPLLQGSSSLQRIWVERPDSQATMNFLMLAKLAPQMIKR